MKVYCPTLPLEGLPNDAELESLWGDSWKRHGWEPVIVPPGGPSYWWEGLEDRFSKIPTINPPGYRIQCITRWVDLFLAGGSIMVDLDLINCGFTPEDCPTPSGEILTFTRDLCPCGVLSRPRETQHLIDLFEDFPENGEGMRALGGVVSSDQEMFRYFAASGDLKIRGLDLAQHFGSPGWETYPLIHFGTGPCLKLGRGKKKLDLIRTFLEQKRV